MLKKTVSACIATMVFATFATAGRAESYPDCPNTRGYCIATDDPEWTNFQVGKDLADIVATHTPNLSLMAIPTAGSADSIERMRYQKGVKFALVHSDVLLYYRNLAGQGHKDADKLTTPLRVVTPLYNDEVHVLVRVPKGDPNGGPHFIHELEKLRIAVGPVGGGGALTAILAYQLMFGHTPAENQLYFSSTDDALNALAADPPRVDAMIVVAAEPVQRFTKIPPSTTNFRMLALDPDNQASQNLLQGPYFPATLRQSLYPWLKADTPTFAVKSYLITQVFSTPDFRHIVKAFTQTLCEQLPELQKSGHPKWKEIAKIGGDLPFGWDYSDDVREALASPSCTTTAPAEPVAAPAPICSPVEIVLRKPGCPEP